MVSMSRYPSDVTAEAIRHATGAQYRISHGDQHATIVQVGGGLREYGADGFPVLDGYRGQPPVDLAEVARDERAED